MTVAATLQPPVPPAADRSPTSRARTTAACSARWPRSGTLPTPTEKVTVKEQSDQADQQHDDLVQHFQAKDPSYDVVSVDVVWVAEFAAKGWLTPLKDKFALDTTGFLEPPVKAVDLQQDALRRPDVLGRRDALLPLRPGADPAEDHRRDVGRCAPSPSRTAWTASPVSSPSTRVAPVTPPSG